MGGSTHVVVLTADQVMLNYTAQARLAPCILRTSKYLDSILQPFTAIVRLHYFTAPEFQ